MSFTPEELALLRASDRVVDQMEPGGPLYRRERGYRRPGRKSPRRTTTHRTKP